jgi:hypothetical protein
LHGAAFVAGGEGVPVFVVRENAKSVRLCEVGRTCLKLGFRPTGLGVSPTGLVFTVDRPGYLQIFQASAGELIPSGEMYVGPNPHGTLVASRGRLYVPIRRGVAVVGPIGPQFFRVIHLPVSPAAIWVSQFSGKLFAALYAIDRIAVVDTTLATARPILFKGFSKPVAVWGTKDYVYEVNAGDRTVCRLDPLLTVKLRCRPVLPHA